MARENPSDAAYDKGVRFQYKTRLPSATHVYKFDCSDGDETDETDTFSGPIVLEVGSGAFSGSVIDKDTGEPIALTEITVANIESPNDPVSISSGINGDYIFFNLLPGTYALYASADGYITSDPVENIIEELRITTVNFELEAGIDDKPGDTDVTNPRINVSSMEVEVGERVFFGGSAEDPDGDELTFYWDYGDDN
jgi:hypothetical protein